MSIKNYFKSNPQGALIAAAVILAAVICIFSLCSIHSYWKNYGIPQAALSMRLPQPPVAVADTKIPGFSLWTMQNEDIALTIGAVKLTKTDDPATAMANTIAYVENAIRNNPHFEKTDFKINQRTQGGKNVQYLTGTAVFKAGEAKANTFVEGIFHLTHESIGFVYAHYNTPKGEEQLRNIFKTVVCE